MTVAAPSALPWPAVCSIGGPDSEPRTAAAAAAARAGATRRRAGPARTQSASADSDPEGEGAGAGGAGGYYSDGAGPPGYEVDGDQDPEEEPGNNSLYNI